MFLFSKQFIRQGTAIVRGKNLNYSLFDNTFSFVSMDSLLKEKVWSTLRSSDFNNLNIRCVPVGIEDIVADIIGTSNPSLPDEHTFTCEYKKLFVHRESCSIDALEFVGPTINQIVQNITIRRGLVNGEKLEEFSLETSFMLLNKKCFLKTITEMCNEDERNGIGYKSSIILFFDSSITTEEAFLIYKAFIRVVQFLAHRRDVYFDCNSYQNEGESISPNGSLFVSIVSENDYDDETKPISIEAVFPIIDKLLEFVLDEKIVPLFIPAKKTVTFSDSYILATAWAQMVFKQVYVPTNPDFYFDGKYDIRDKSIKGNPKINFQKQLTSMITESFPYISDFHQIAIQFLLKGQKIEDYSSNVLPNRLKSVRNAIAHGSEDPKDYEYTHLDMIFLLCAIYSSILKKKLGLDDKHLKLALSELFFDSTEAFAQWRNLHQEKECY